MTFSLKLSAKSSNTLNKYLNHSVSHPIFDKNDLKNQFCNPCSSSQGSVKWLNKKIISRNRHLTGGVQTPASARRESVKRRSGSATNPLTALSSPSAVGRTAPVPMVSTSVPRTWAVFNKIVQLQQFIIFEEKRPIKGQKFFFLFQACHSHSFSDHRKEIGSGIHKAQFGENL